MQRSTHSNTRGGAGAQRVACEELRTTIHWVVWARRVWTRSPIHGVVWARREWRARKYAPQYTGGAGAQGVDTLSNTRGGAGAQGVDTHPKYTGGVDAQGVDTLSNTRGGAGAQRVACEKVRTPIHGWCGRARCGHAPQIHGVVRAGRARTRAHLRESGRYRTTKKRIGLPNLVKQPSHGHKQLLTFYTTKFLCLHLTPCFLQLSLTFNLYYLAFTALLFSFISCFSLFLVQIYSNKINYPNKKYL